MIVPGIGREWCVEKITILLADLPQMLREIIQDIIARQPDMEIRGEFSNPLELLLAAKEIGVDAVIVELQDSQEPGLCSHLFAECPTVTILGLASADGSAFIEQLCPWRKDITDPSEAAIIDALRQAVRMPCSSGEREINGRSSNLPLELAP
jgi:DNA-binding NarL/FixJ family response regulator